MSRVWSKFWQDPERVSQPVDLRLLESGSAGS